MVSMSEDDRSRNVEGRAARKVELVLKCPGTLESGEEVMVFPKSIKILSPTLTTTVSKSVPPSESVTFNSNL